MPERVIGEGAVRVDPVRHDLGDRVGLDDIDPLERRHERLLGRGKGGRDRPDPDVPSRLGRRLVDARAQGGQRPLAARGNGRRVFEDGRLIRRPPGRRPLPRPPVARVPVLGLEPAVVEAEHELAPGRDADAHEVGARGHQRRRVFGRCLHRRRREREPEPRPGRVAEDAQQFQPGGPVRVEPLQRPRRDSARLGLGSRAAIGLGQQLRLEREVDRAVRDVEGQLLGRDVVLAERDRERQGNARGESVARPADVPLDDGRGERHPVVVQAADAEEAQEGAFAGGRRGRARTGAPRAGEVVGATQDRVEALGRAAGRLAHPLVAHPPGVCVRATCPIQTWPSAKRSAFQIGARAFVSSMA